MACQNTTKRAFNWEKFSYRNRSEPTWQAETQVVLLYHRLVDLISKMIILLVLYTLKIIKNWKITWNNCGFLLLDFNVCISGQLTDVKF